MTQPLFDIPRGIVFPVERVDVALLPGAHPFEAENLAAIEADWARQRVANPALFDGRIALLTGLRYAARRLVGSSHLVRYASFLYWRKERGQGAGHAFAHAMPVTSDGALIAVRMGSHTANPGAVYFAAGSFEAEDFSDGKVDIDRNMAREVKEETGLELAPLDRDPIWHAWSGDAGTVVSRRFRLPMTAEGAAARIRDFVAAEAEPEIEGPVIIRSAADLPATARSHMPALVEWHFNHRPNFAPSRA
jgi:8-oxo-dGTP pyrophosphatase MutT (NUDIX family)